MIRIITLLVILFSVSSLSAKDKILAFSGSTREGSLNTLLVKEAGAYAKERGADVMLIDLRDYPVPSYHAYEEKKKGMPNNAKKLRQMMIDSDSVVIASPEYNGRLPAALRNVLNWSARNSSGNPSKKAFEGKKFAIMSASMNGSGGLQGLAKLRKLIESNGGKVIKIEVSLPEASDAFDENGKLVDPAKLQELKQEIDLLLGVGV